MINLIFVGSLTERKKPNLLLDALKYLIDKKFNVKLAIIGNGPLKDFLYLKSLQLNLHKHIKFYGHLDDPYELINASDILLLPSLSEGTSRASLEALYYGLICVLRNVDGNNELIDDINNGFLFNDNNDFTEKIIKAINLVQSKQFIKKNLLPNKFREKFIIKKYIDILNEK